MIPLYCVKIDAYSQKNSPTSIKTIAPLAKPKDSDNISLVYHLLTRPSEKVLEVVINTPDAARRIQYLEKLKPRFVNQDQELTGAKKHWAKLRTDWKVAVRYALDSKYEEWENKRKRDAFWRMLAQNYKLDT